MVLPQCADPGAPITVSGTRPPNSITQVKLLANPYTIDPHTAQDVGGVDPSKWIDLGTFDVSSGTLSASVKLPTPLALDGAPIDGWSIESRSPSGQVDVFGGYVDSKNQIAAAVDSVAKGNPINYRAASFGTSKLYAHVKRGKTVKTFSLAKSMVDTTPNGSSCGFAFGGIPTKKLKKGSYSVTIGTKKSGGGAKAGRVKVT